MNLESDLRNIRPALDRAMAAAATVDRGTLRPPRLPSRRKAAVVAFAVAVCVAAVVGIVARLDSGGHGGGHGGGVAPIATTGVTRPTASSTTEATTTRTAPETTTITRAEVPLRSVDWAAVNYPLALHCGAVFHPPVTVGHVEYAEPAVGVPLAIVEVACTHGAGTPPVEVYVYDGATSTTTPHLAGTLVAESDGWQANAFTVDGATVSLPVDGFSSASLPNCCPDVHTTLVWRWNGGRYDLVSSVPPHVPGPAFGGY